MSESIKNKAIRGVAWSAVEKFARQGLMVFFSILIARQLSPADYGLVAMLTIFLVVAQIFVDSGFVEALIQKRDRTEVDFSTTFWFNIGVADVGLAGLAAKPAQRGVTLGIGGLDALARVLPPLVPVFL